MLWSVSRRVLVVVLAVVLGIACSPTVMAAPIGPDVIARLTARLSYVLQHAQHPLTKSPTNKRSRSGGTTSIDLDGGTIGSNPSTMGSCVDPHGQTGSCPGIEGPGGG